MELKEQIQQDYKDSEHHLHRWRTEALESYDFVGGKQFSDEEEAKMIDNDRPVVVFNRCLPYVNAVAGMEIAQRMQTTLLPREPTDLDSGQAELGTALIRWIRDGAEATTADSQAFNDCVITGLGWVEQNITEDEFGEPVISIERVHPMEIGYDPAAPHPMLGRYLWRRRDFSPDEFRTWFPEAEMPAKNAWLSSHEVPQARDGDAYEGESQLDRPKQDIRVLEYLYYESEYVHVYPKVETWELDNTPVDHSEEEFDRDREFLNDKDFAAPRRTRRTYYRAFVVADGVIRIEKSPSQVGWNYRCMTGWQDGRTGLYRGLVESMKDPQRWANKFFSHQMHTMSTAAGGGMMYEIGAFEDPEEALENWSSDDHIALAEGGLEKVRQKREVSFSPQTGELLQFAIRAIEDVTGISKEMLGVVPREQSGVVETSRKRAAYAMLSPLMESIRVYHRQQARVLLDMANRYFPPQMWFRIGSQFQPKDYRQFSPITIKYDVIVEESPTSQNSKEQTWIQLVQMLPQLLGAGIPIPPVLLDYTPLPAPLVREWKAHIEQQQSQPDPAAELAQQKEIAEIEHKKAQTAAEHASAMLDQVRAMVQRGQIEAQQGRQLAEQFLKAQNNQLQAASIAHQERKSTLDYDSKMASIFRDILKMEQESKQAPRQ